MFKCLGFDNWLIEVLRKGLIAGTILSKRWANCCLAISEMALGCGCEILTKRSLRLDLERRALSAGNLEDVGGLMQEEPPRWFDRIPRDIESSALFVWFMRRRSRGLKARRWVEGWTIIPMWMFRSWIAMCARAGRRFA